MTEENKLTDEVFNECGMIAKASYGHGRTFNDYDGSTSVRSDYNRGDYELFRPSEYIPKDSKGIIALCMSAYENVGIIKNVIDLMGDFTCQGIRIVHQNKSIERFLNRWWTDIINGNERSNAFCNLLYRGGQVPVYRMDGKISQSSKKRLKSAKGDDAAQEEKVEKRTIPVKYVFFDPLSIEIVGGDLAAFIGDPVYKIKILRNIRDGINNMNANSPQYRDYIPLSIQNAVATGYLDIDQDRFKMYHYKKDDWRIWSMPVVQPILKDLMQLEKLRLADLSALDGAISAVRLWTVGDIEHGIIPTPASLNILKNALANNNPGRVLDLVWTEGLTFKESSSNAHQFLGPAKYQATLNAIYAGLGIPPTLTGTSDASGFTNNYIAIKTLVERLNYGRSILVSFWNKELKRIQKSMGFVKPGTVVFDNDVLADDQVYKKFLIDLIDREYLSMESLHDKIRIPHEIEKSRIAKEQRERYSGKLPDKASPYHKPQIDDELRKIILMSGGVAPSEVGIELLPRKDGEETLNEMKMKGMPQTQVQKPVRPNGRPLGQKDSTKRKQRQGYIRTGAFTNLLVWASESQKAISELLTPAILSHYGKSNCRKLSNQESEVLESMKFRVLCCLEPYTKITPENVHPILNEEYKKSIAEFITAVSDFSQAFVDKNQRQPNIEERRQIQITAYSYIHARKQNIDSETKS